MGHNGECSRLGINKRALDMREGKGVCLLAQELVGGGRGRRNWMALGTFQDFFLPQLKVKP